MLNFNSGLSNWLKVNNLLSSYVNSQDYSGLFDYLVVHNLISSNVTGKITRDSEIGWLFLMWNLF